MKILIDIGHPAHVHYFKNFIGIMKKRDHEFFVIAKNRHIIPDLLREYKIEFVLRKDFPKNIICKLFNIPLADAFVLKHALQFKPNILIGFSGTHISHVGKLIRKPSVVLDDTECATLAHASYKSFASAILTPMCFKKDFGYKQIRFDGYFELSYLHPNYFTPDPSILELLGVKKKEKFVIFRFVSWNASHDIGEKGFSLKMKIKVVREISKYAKVFISSEEELPEVLKQYQIMIHPEKIHDVLAFASLYIGEGGTTANECACLGTPNILVNSLVRAESIPGVHLELENYGLQYLFDRYNQNVLTLAKKILQTDKIKNMFKDNRKKLIKNTIDVTSFLVKFIENFPDSKYRILIKNKNKE